MWIGFGYLDWPMDTCIVVIWSRLYIIQLDWDPSFDVTHTYLLIVKDSFKFLVRIEHGTCVLLNNAFGT